jgi:heme/copper-type cytochrome/quinol oxidase subunit 2
MQVLLVIALLLMVVVFGLSSMSQSYAAAQQAQAAIEASRSAQIASTGNLVTIFTVMVVVVAVIVASVIMFQFHYGTTQSRRKQVTGPNADRGEIPQSQTADLLPTLMTMMLYQMMQNRKQQDAHPLTMDQPADELLEAPDDFWRM